MEGDQTSAFSAAGQALGYLAQVDFALLAMLTRMDDEDDFSVSIETLDDIVFHHNETDDPTEKWQSKHSIDGDRSLSDASTDLWKTLHNWIVEPSDDSVRLVLLATARAGEAAAKLRPAPGRDVAGALAALERTARESQSQTNTAYYAAFRALAPEARSKLLDRIDVIDGTVTAADLDDEFVRAVRKSVVARRRPALVLRLRGWWHRRAIMHLEAVARGHHDRITLAELEEQLLSIADSLRDDNLPIDVFALPEPTTDEVSDDDRIFVAQLRLIAMGSARLGKCIYDHNRAFAQRSIWQRDRLLEVGELSQYDRELREAWERFFLPLSDAEGLTDDEIRAQALDHFSRLDQSDLAPIRRDVRAGFISRGSLQMMADRLEIGWHPQWLDHLKHRLPEVRDSADEAAA
jgi:hypothetical protein